MGLQRVRHDWSNSAHTHAQAASYFLPTTWWLSLGTLDGPPSIIVSSSSVTARWPHFFSLLLDPSLDRAGTETFWVSKLCAHPKEFWEMDYSCHIRKQEHHIYQWFWPSRCEFLSPLGHPGRRTVPAIQQPWGCSHSLWWVWRSGCEKTQDMDPRELRCMWKGWFHWTQTFGSSHT